MAQPIEKMEPVDRPRGPAKVVPLTAGSSISPHETQFLPTSTIGGLEDRAGRAVAHAMQSLSPALEQTRILASGAFVYLWDQSRTSAKQLRNRTEQIKREHPVKFLYGVAAAAFVLGVALRIWRSSGHEYRG